MLALLYTLSLIGLWGFQGCFFMQIILTAVRTLKMSLESGFYGISHNCVPFIYFYALLRGKHIVAALSVRYLVKKNFKNYYWLLNLTWYIYRW